LYKNISIFVIISVIFTGCIQTKNNLNVSNFSSKIKDKLNIPEDCRAEYNTTLPTVAVVDFTNNSTFGKASINSSNKKENNSFFAGIGISPVGAGVGAVVDSNETVIKTKREVDAKLSASIVPLIEDIVISSGGAKLFSRNDMDKIDNELKFQDSGLIDPNSAVEFGKLSGVRYIITVSIDNVEQEYKGNSDIAAAAQNVASHTDNKDAQIATGLVRLFTEWTDGMIVKTSVTIRVIDVQTGKILFSKIVRAKKNIGKIKKPTYDQIIGAIKSSIQKSLNDVKSKLSEYFSIKGYITQIRKDGDQLIAQVNIGNKYNVVENQKFAVYSFEENTDPMTNKTTCDKILTPVVLKASNQITNTHTWASVETNGGSIKLLQLVRKLEKEESGFAFPKF
jgi:hypothetical protein